MWNGLDDNLKVGDEVYIVEQSDYQPRGRGFGISIVAWEEAISGGPYIITEVVTETWDGGWLGYKIDKDFASDDYSYTCPCWAFELANAQTTTIVENLL